MASGKPRFHAGDIVDAEKLGRDGWFVGHFVKNDRTRYTRRFEVKSWHFPKGKTPHGPKRSMGVWEFTLVLKGRGRGVINGEDVELKEGQYFVVRPNTCNNFPAYVLEPIRGITLKAPSIEGSKKTC